MSDGSKPDCRGIKANKQRKMTLDSPSPWKWVNFIIIVIIPSCSAIIALLSFWYGYQNNLRAEKLFGSQIRPLIQERPYNLTFDPSTGMTKTNLEIVNYSGFDAIDVTFDIKYGTNDWIVEWMRAEIHRLRQLNPRTPQEDKRLKELSEAPVGIATLKSGQKFPIFVVGSLSLNDVCSNPEGTEVLARITWKNENGWLFDRIHKFKLVCTKVENGRSFTFLPEGIIAQQE